MMTITRKQAFKFEICVQVNITKTDTLFERRIMQANFSVFLFVGLLQPPSFCWRSRCNSFKHF